MVTPVPAQMSGTVWKVEKQLGDPVVAGEVVVILESMKMEIPHEAPSAGTILEMRVKASDAVGEGDILFSVG